MSAAAGGVFVSRTSVIVASVSNRTPATDTAFWIAAVGTFALSALAWKLQPHRAEPGHRTSLPVWIKLPIIVACMIVLGGGISNIARLYANVPTRWGPYVFSDHVATRLVPHRHGDSSGVRGAAWLWNE